MKSYRRKDHIDLSNTWRQELEIERAVRNGNFQMLVEMAIPLKNFLTIANGLRRQIAINWCLCKWCQLFDPGNENFNHWKDELATHMSNLNDISIKKNIKKNKHLYKIWVVDYDFDDKDIVLRVIANKFTKENINDMAQREAVAEAFAQHVEDVINVISSSINNALDYVKQTFAVSSELDVN